MALALTCAAVVGCSISWSGTKTVRGSGHVISEARPGSSFDRVAVAGSGHLSIFQGEDESLTIEADDNLLPLIKSSVSGGWLRLGPENVNLSPTSTIRYSLQLKSLRELSLSGSLEADAPALKTDQLTINISGSGRVRLPKLDAGGFDVHISGSGDIDVAGKVDRQSCQISGSGNYRAGDCESQSAAIHISGAGDATVWVHRSLDAHVSGSGNIRYYGAPQVSSGISGSGSVHSLGNK